jgi:hypothetical protein
MDWDLEGWRAGTQWPSRALGGTGRRPVPTLSLENLWVKERNR